MQRNLIVTLFFVCTLFASPSWSQEEGDAVRPANIYAYYPATGKVDMVKVKFRSPDLKQLFMENEKGEKVCQGTLGSRGNNWLFQNLNCFNGAFRVDELDLKEIVKFGVIKHSVNKVILADGTVVGFFIHFGSDGRVSDVRVPEEKIKELYGDFPNWKLPN